MNMKKLMFVFVTVLLGLSLHAQQDDIIWLNYEPDFVTRFYNVLDRPPFEVILDMDQDGDMEFMVQRLIHRQYVTFQVGFYSLSYYSQRISVTPGFTIGDTLANFNWGYPGQSYICRRPICGYDPIHSQELWTEIDEHHFFVFKKESEDGTRYGWIELSFYSPEGPGSWGDVIIHQWVYCTIPDYPLRLGQTSIDWDLCDEKAMHFAICPNPGKGSVTVSGAQIAEVRLHNVAGQLVATQAGNSTESLTMDISSLPSGLYFVTVTGQDGRKSVQKVVKE